MNVLRKIVCELCSMFAGDVVMSVLVIPIVAGAAGLRFLTVLPSPLVGAGLILGCLFLLAVRVLSHANLVGKS